MASGLRLVGDIGGTNARFAVADASGERPVLLQPQSFLCADFACCEAAIDAYLAETGLKRPDSVVVAFAGPITDGAADATNGSWQVAETSLRAHGFEHARLINDYAALAYGAPFLRGEDLATLGPDLPPAEGSLAILGAGTGFGVSALARDGISQTPLVTEGGHTGFAPVDETEDKILLHLRERYGRVSVERILSGPGMTDLHWALGRIAGKDLEPLQASEIVARAKAGDDALCVETLDRFCAIYGSAAGDIALVIGARGGVYLGGGIAPRILDTLLSGDFRQRFEAKGRFVDYMAAIPTQVILHPFAALLGGAVAPL